MLRCAWLQETEENGQGEKALMLCVSFFNSEGEACATADEVRSSKKNTSLIIRSTCRSSVVWL